MKRNIIIESLRDKEWYDCIVIINNIGNELYSLNEDKTKIIEEEYFYSDLQTLLRFGFDIPNQLLNEIDFIKLMQINADVYDGLEQRIKQQIENFETGIDDKSNIKEKMKVFIDYRDCFENSEQLTHQLNETVQNKRINLQMTWNERSVQTVCERFEFESETDEEMKDNSNEYKELKEKYDEMKNEFESQKEEQMIMKQELEEKNEIIDELQKENEELKSQLKQYETIQSEQNNFNEMFRQLKEDYERIKKENEQLQINLDVMKKGLENVTSSQKELLTIFLSLQEQLNEKDRINEELQKQLDDFLMKK